MAQKFSIIGESEKVSNSFGKINFNDQTILSNSAGTVFPTTNLEVGMFCWRTDRNELYQLISLDPVTWKIRFGEQSYDFVDVFNTVLLGSNTNEGV